MEKGSAYQHTLQLPITEFPMRGDLAKREPAMLEKWESEDYYGQLQDLGRAQNRPTFVLHDGPPYANGNIHIGTALNKVLKDIVMRSRSLAGYHVPYVPGWDTHGLPIELHVVRALGPKRQGMTVSEFREHCAAYALEQIDIQRSQFRRLGVWGEWDNPYITMKPEYEAVQVRLFGDMVEKGYVYKAKKPVYWCADCQTALAEAEIEYGDHRSPSIFVRFPVKDGKGILAEETTITMQLRLPGKTHTLLISADPVHPSLHTVEDQPTNPAQPPAFCMLLRKYLEPSRLLKVEQQGFDRIVHLHFEALDESGQLTELILIFEVMGRQSNLYLVNSSGVIIDALKRFPERGVFPGERYRAPSDQGKRDPSAIPEGDFLDDLRLLPLQTPIWKWISDSFQGFSKTGAQEVVRRASFSPAVTKGELSEADWTQVHKAFRHLLAEIAAGGTPCFYPDLEDFAAYALAGQRRESYTSVNKLIGTVLSDGNQGHWQHHGHSRPAELRSDKRGKSKPSRFLDRCKVHSALS
jgi:hypothetical protein